MEHKIAIITGSSSGIGKSCALELLKQKCVVIGIDKEELGGSAWEAAITSFVLFAIGAIIPLFPFFILKGYNAIYLSVGASVVGLFGIGAAITLFTGKGVFYSGMRQVFFGLAAAAVTFGIGTLIGVSLAG